MCQSTTKNGVAQTININMKNGCYDDSFKWGWDTGWYNLPESDKPVFKVGLTSAGTSLSFRAEVIRAAKLLVESATKPLAVLLSGGLDSQVICLALQTINFPFIAVTVNWTHRDGKHINDDDVNDAREFARMHGIMHIVHEMCIDHALDNFVRPFVQRYQVEMYRLPALLAIVDMYKDTYTIVGGGHTISFDEVDNELVVSFMSEFTQQYLTDNGIEGTLHFYLYTPELILSQIDNTISRSFMMSHGSLFDAFRVNSVTPMLTWRVYTTYVKPLVYAQQWDGLIHKTKRHGFETFDDRELKQDIHRLGSNKLSGMSTDINIPVDKFLSFMKRPKGTKGIWTAKLDVPSLASWQVNSNC